MRNKKGFSVIEFLVASILIITVVSSTSLSISVSKKSQQVTYANDLASEIANNIFRSLRGSGCDMLLNENDSKVPSSLNGCREFPIVGNNELNSCDGIVIPNHDSNNLIFSPNKILVKDGVCSVSGATTSTMNFKIKFNTRWDKSCSVNSFNPSECPPISSNGERPDLFIRELQIDAYNGSNTTPIFTKKYVDMQAIDLTSTAFGFNENGETDKGYLVINSQAGNVVELTTPNTNVKIYKTADKNGRAFFPFLIPTTGSTKYSYGTNNSINIVAGQTNVI